MRHGHVDQAGCREDAAERPQRVGDRTHYETAAGQLHGPQPAQRIEGVADTAPRHFERVKPPVVVNGVEGEDLVEAMVAACQAALDAEEAVDIVAQAAGRLGERPGVGGDARPPAHGEIVGFVEDRPAPRRGGTGG